MKKIIKTIFLVLICVNSLILVSCKCSKKSEYELDTFTNFKETKNLKDGSGKKTKVIVLMGQSNASGASLTSYLEKNTSIEEYQKYENGFNNVLINYFIDNGTNTSNGEFVKVDLNCGCTKGYFGPEVGMASVLSKEYPNEEVFILKYTYSGTSLVRQWLFDKERFSIYNAAVKFIKYYMDILISKNYDATIDAICFMQGESDSGKDVVKKYYRTLKAFVKYLRSDLEEYQNKKGIYFIDAGISNSKLWSPGYITINKAKERFSKLSKLNIYFSNIELGLTEKYEPVENPDLAHYDSLSEIKLGEEFARRIIEIYK